MPGSRDTVDKDTVSNNNNQTSIIMHKYIF